MKLFLLSLLLTLFFGSSAMAQDASFVEVFGGYSHQSLDPTSRGGERASLNGWHTNVSMNLVGFLEVEADLSGAYGNLNGRKVNLHTFMAGPRFDLEGEKLSFFFHILYGISKISGEGAVLTPLIGLPSDSGLAIVPLGGGFEININKKFSYRVAQFDLIVATWGSNSGHSHPRFSTGVVFNLGN